MTRRARRASVLAAAAACLPLAACGDDDVGDNDLRRRGANDLEQRLDEIQGDIDAGSCDEGQAKIAQLRVEVDKLNDEGVGSDVQDAIGDGVDRLGDLARRVCEENEEPVETTPETTPEPTITETTPEPTTPEPTTPAPTTPEPTTPVPAPEEEPDEGDGEGQFGPGGVPPGQLKKDDDD